MMVLPFFALLTLALAEPLVVDLGYARYHGRSTPMGVSQWLGMRYADAPVGSLRFEAPQDPSLMKGTQQATQVRRNPYLCFI